MPNLNIELLNIGDQLNIDLTIIFIILFAISFSVVCLKEAVFENLPLPKELT